MKKESDENTRKVNDEEQPTNVIKDPDENKIPKDIKVMKAEKEFKKSISRWDSDGGVELCE